MRINYLWLPFLTASAVSYFFSLLGFDLLALGAFLVGVAALTKISGERNLFHLMWLVGLYVFVCCPLIIFSVVDYDFDFTLAIIILLLSGVAVRFTQDRDYVQGDVGGRKFSLVEIGAIGLAIVLLSLIIGKSAYFYFYPALIMVFSASLRGRSILLGGISFFLVLCVFLFYFLFIWEGFGRLVISCWIIVPGLIFIFSYNLYFNKWAFYIGASIASIFMSMLRFSGADAANIIQYVMKDSTTSPYRLADQIMNQGDALNQGSGIFGILDQYLLFFVGAFPRDIWESKPLGFGAVYTIDNLSANLVAAGHSIAALFVGEHMYYLGGVGGTVSALVSTLLVCILFRVSYRISPSSQVLSIPVSLYLTSYFWVGMATYSQRLQQGFLFILVAWLASHFLRKISR